MKGSLAGPTHIRVFIRRALQGHAQSTARAYQSDLHYLEEWFQQVTGSPLSLPVDSRMLVRFVEDHSSCGASTEVIDPQAARSARQFASGTIARRLSVLRAMHRLEGFPDPGDAPEVRDALRHARRVAAQKPKPRRKAITLDVLTAMLATCAEDTEGVRDRAILLVAFASGGRRRSEIAALELTDLELVADGYLITIRRSKTDQSAQGHVVPVLGKAGQALHEWLVKSKIRDGRLFRAVRSDGSLTASLSDRTIARMVKHRIAQAGYNPREFSAHSLRAGFITESARQRVALADAMALSGHKTVGIALRYYRAGSVLKNPAGRLIG